jgi:hypothetical protein
MTAIPPVPDVPYRDPLEILTNIVRDHGCSWVPKDRFSSLIPLCGIRARKPAADSTRTFAVGHATHEKILLVVIVMLEANICAGARGA